MYFSLKRDKTIRAMELKDNLMEALDNFSKGFIDEEKYIAVKRELYKFADMNFEGLIKED